MLAASTYAEYLASDLWASIRETVMRKHRGRCKLCGKPATEVHHINYTRSALEGRKFTQMRPLCRECHKSVELHGDRKLPFKTSRKRYFGQLRANKR